MFVKLQTECYSNHLNLNENKNEIEKKKPTTSVIPVESLYELTAGLFGKFKRLCIFSAFSHSH